jgi:hypothetical protein
MACVMRHPSSQTPLEGPALSVVVWVASGWVGTTRWTTGRPCRDRIAVATVVTALMENYGVGLSFSEMLGVHSADPKLTICDRRHLDRRTKDRRTVNDVLTAARTIQNVPHFTSGYDDEAAN